MMLLEVLDSCHAELQVEVGFSFFFLFGSLNGFFLFKAFVKVLGDFLSLYRAEDILPFCRNERMHTCSTSVRAFPSCGSVIKENQPSSRMYRSM